MLFTLDALTLEPSGFCNDGVKFKVVDWDFIILFNMMVVGR